MKWRESLKDAQIVSPEISHFLDVLEGAPPDESLYQQVASSLHALSTGIIAPSDLWIASFRLLNIFMNDRQWVESPLEGLLITRWLHAVRSQSFAFSAPSVVRPEIEKVCANQTCKGIAKIATILNISRIHLRIPVSETAIGVLVKIGMEISETGPGQSDKLTTLVNPNQIAGLNSPV